MHRISRVMLVLAVFALFGGAALAAGDWTDQLRFGFSYNLPTSDESGNMTVQYVSYAYAVPETAKQKGALGFAVSYEHKFTPLMGLEFGVAYYKPEFRVEFNFGEEASEQYSDKIRVMPLSVAWNFHLTQGKGTDFYIGPVLAYMFYGKGSLSFASTEALNVKFKDELAYGVRLGVDFPIDPKWTIALRADYLRAKARVDTIEWSETGGATGARPQSVVAPHFAMTNDFKPNPLLISVMAGYKF